MSGEREGHNITTAEELNSLLETTETREAGRACGRRAPDGHLSGGAAAWAANRRSRSRSRSRERRGGTGTEKIARQLRVRWENAGPPIAPASAASSTAAPEAQIRIQARSGQPQSLLERGLPTQNMTNVTYPGAHTEAQLCPCRQPTPGRWPIPQSTLPPGWRKKETRPTSRHLINYHWPRIPGE